MEVLESSNNKLVKRLLSYAQKKYRDEDSVFIVEGQRFVEEITNGWEVLCYGFREDCAHGDLWDKVFLSKHCHVFSTAIFQRIAQTKSPQGVFALCRQKKWELANIFCKNKAGFYILLEGLNDPGNLGTIIRTADAGGADGILLSKGSVELYNPKVLRATMGSLFHLPIIENIDLKESILMLKSQGVMILAGHLEGQVLPYDIDMRQSVAILIGNEANGLSIETSALCDKLVKIPMIGKAESLNASMAAGILIYEGVRQRVL